GPAITSGLPVAYCLSPAVADAAARLPWRAVRVAREPNTPSLLRLVEDDRPKSEEPTMKEPEAVANGPAQPDRGATVVEPSPSPSREPAHPGPARTAVVAALVALVVALIAPLLYGLF